MGLSPILDPNSTDKEIQQRQFKKVNEQIDKLKDNFGGLQDKKKEELIEIGRLRGQKIMLHTEIKHLFNTVDLLKGGKEEYVKAYDQYTDERLAILKGLGVVLTKDLIHKEDKLDVRSNVLDKNEAFLIELADYLTQYEEICEATRSTNASTSVDLVGKAIDVATQRKEAEKSSIIASVKTKEADSKFSLADSNYIEADSLVKFFKDVADKEHSRLDGRIKNIALNAKLLLEKEKTLKGKEIRLKEKEGWLDREIIRIQKIAESIRVG